MTGTENNSVSVVILSHNRLDEISRNLPRLLSERSTFDEFEIIVVDNNSTDGSREFLINLQKEHPEIILVLNEKNKGVGGGRNSGFSMVNRKYVVALDDDTSIAIDELRQIPSLFEKYNRAGILAFRVVHPITGYLQNPHGDIPCEVANHHGAGFAIRRELLNILGGIDEECDFGAEELDFAIRVHAQGWQVLYVPELIVYHNSLETINRELKIIQFRRMRRVFNNVRTYYKFFSVSMASRNSRRYTLIAIRSWVMTQKFNGLKDILRIMQAHSEGRKAGLLKHQSVPAKTVEFYNNSNLRPEFGNVPLYRKVIDRIKLSKNN